MSSHDAGGGAADEFHVAMVTIFKRAIAEVKPAYRARQFLSMVVEHGGVEAAKRLLHADEEQSGFTRLWEAKKLGLSVEAHVVQPRFSHLFTPEEVATARERLQRHGYEP